MKIYLAGFLFLISGSCLGQRSRELKCSEDGLFPHEQYCDYYYECKDGIKTLQECPNGLVFRGKRRGLYENCDYPKRAGCPDGIRTIGQSPIETDHCKWLWGRFQHETSCRRFWECWNGTETLHNCPFSLLYNNEIEACDWPSNVQGCQAHPVCREVQHGPIPIPSRCVIYWFCNNGFPQLYRCASGLAFSPTTLNCEYAQTVPGCEPPPTTPAPREEENRRGPNDIQPIRQPQPPPKPAKPLNNEKPAPVRPNFGSYQGRN
ncbi:protein obstructor-E-like [Tachypleus tridentatus]|uniref:protein obstructor-E-like n=1 Tax=Tachypleus tridentatus TaxID=6853 RepID=UPI003FD52228